jgi:nitric oxide reductase NorD protein
MDITPSRAIVVERRTTSGCDVDYDEAVEALADIRADGGIDDSVYLDQRRKRRVLPVLPVLLLVDVRASTADRVEDAEPVELALLPILAELKLRPPRILDIEVISSLLCTSALNSVGDAFSVWSFSGTNWEQVVLSETKGFNEPMSGVVAARAAGMKPMHATRLGAAIRHCGMVLSKLQTETKVLLVLTDGQLLDIDYGTSYVKEEPQSYALAGSDKALYELTEGGIEPYVRTVDPSTEEYISEPKSVKVEILDDLRALFEDLLRLYEGLLDRYTAAVAPMSHRHGPNQVISQTSGGITR